MIEAFHFSAITWLPVDDELLINAVNRAKKEFRESGSKNIEALLHNPQQKLI
jgi:hypothetical protein